MRDRASTMNRDRLNSERSLKVRSANEFSPQRIKDGDNQCILECSTYCTSTGYRCIFSLYNELRWPAGVEVSALSFLDKLDINSSPQCEGTPGLPRQQIRAGNLETGERDRPHLLRLHYTCTPILTRIVTFYTYACNNCLPMVSFSFEATNKDQANKGWRWSITFGIFPLRLMKLRAFIHTDAVFRTAKNFWWIKSPRQISAGSN